MRLLLRILRIRAVRRLLTLSILSGWLSGVAGIGQAYALASLINAVFLAHQTLPQVSGWLYILAGCVLLRAALTYGTETSASRAAQHAKDDLRRSLLETILERGPGFTQQERSGELVNTLLGGIDNLDAYVSQYLPAAGLAILLPFTFLAIILPLDPLSGLALALTGPLIPLFLFLIGSQSRRLTHRQWQRLSQMSAVFYDTLRGLTTLKIFGRSREQPARIAEISERYRLTTLEVMRITFLSALALELLTTIGTAVVAVEVGLRLLAGEVEFFPAFFILLLAPDFYLPLRTLGLRFHASMAGKEAAKRIEEIEKITPPWQITPPWREDRSPVPPRKQGGQSEEKNFPSPHEQAGEQKKDGFPSLHKQAGQREEDGFPSLHKQAGQREEDGFPSPHEQAEGKEEKGFPSSHKQRAEQEGNIVFPSLLAGRDRRAIFSPGWGEPPSITFRAVSYTYAGQSAPAVENISFHIYAGETLALVGLSGAGKSTLMKLLLGFDSPTSGEILVNGAPLASMPLEEWRSTLAWLPERPALLSRTLAENLRLAAPIASDADLRTAIIQAGLSEWFAALPLGFSTRLGEGGSTLSGGQAQRIALARAFLRRPALFLLDEPTAHLDLATEESLLPVIHRLFAGRTGVVIAHRLPTIRAAQQIGVMQAGQLVEIGSHADLMTKRGAYWQINQAYTDADANAEPPL